MRWERLFEDLAGQLQRGLDVEQDGLALEEEQHRRGRLGLRDRLVALVGPVAAADSAHGGEQAGASLVVETAAGAVLSMRIDAVGRDWIAGSLAAEGVRRSTLVPLAAVAALRLGPERRAAGPGPQATGEAPAADGLAARLGIAVVLRDLARRRVPIALATGTGLRHGTIDRVGRDHLDLAEHDPAEQRRSGALRIVPLDRIDHLRY